MTIIADCVCAKSYILPKLFGEGVRSTINACYRCFGLKVRLQRMHSILRLRAVTRKANKSICLCAECYPPQSVNRLFAALVNFCTAIPKMGIYEPDIEP